MAFVIVQERYKYGWHGVDPVKRILSNSDRFKKSISNAIARKLGHYVYLYINPLDGQIFYVGKGRGKRVLSHLDDHSGSEKSATIKKIRKAGEEPQIEILAHGLPDERTAFRVEAAAIDLLKLSHLSNIVRGWNSLRYGRRPLAELISIYRKKPAKIKEPAILIRISKVYRPDMSPAKLYDATRGTWKLGPKREKAHYAFAIFEGIVREVYEITQWLPAGSTFNYRNPKGMRSTDRWEFVGRVAPENIRRKHIDRYVGHYFPRGAQYPIAYVNVQ